MRREEDPDVLYADVRSRILKNSIEGLPYFDAALEPEQALKIWDLPPVPHDIDFRVVRFGASTLVAGRFCVSVWLRPTGDEEKRYRVGRRIAKEIDMAFSHYGFPLRLRKQGRGLNTQFIIGPPTWDD